MLLLYKEKEMIINELHKKVTLEKPKKITRQKFRQSPSNEVASRFWCRRGKNAPSVITTETTRNGPDWDLERFNCFDRLIDGQPLMFVTLRWEKQRFYETRNDPERFRWIAKGYSTIWATTLARSLSGLCGWSMSIRCTFMA